LGFNSQFQAKKSGPNCLSLFALELNYILISPGRGAHDLSQGEERIVKNGRGKIN
jgi:hypothetical protein